jgi:P63C domain
MGQASSVRWQIHRQDVYDALPPGVADELKRRLPKNEHGNRKARLWQLLTVDTGSPHLDRQLTATITLMQVSDDKKSFDENFERVFGRQTRLALVFRENPA